MEGRFSRYKNRKALTNKEIIHLKYSNADRHDNYIEDKDFIKKRIEEIEKSKKEITWSSIAK